MATNTARMIVATMGCFTHFPPEDDLQELVDKNDDHMPKKIPCHIGFGLCRAQGLGGGFFVSNYSAVG
eukprot:2766636-Ditylum_brightwellii.AAC.1